MFSMAELKLLITRGPRRVRLSSIRDRFTGSAVYNKIEPAPLLSKAALSMAHTARDDDTSLEGVSLIRRHSHISRANYRHHHRKSKGMSIPLQKRSQPHSIFLNFYSHFLMETVKDRKWTPPHYITASYRWRKESQLSTSTFPSNRISCVIKWIYKYTC